MHLLKMYSYFGDFSFKVPVHLLLIRAPLIDEGLARFNLSHLPFINISYQIENEVMILGHSHFFED